MGAAYAGTAARLVEREGYDVTGTTKISWDPHFGEALLSGCVWRLDVNDRLPSSM